MNKRILENLENRIVKLEEANKKLLSLLKQSTKNQILQADVTIDFGRVMVDAAADLAEVKTKLAQAQVKAGFIDIIT